MSNAASKVFSYAEANEMVPKVAALTERVIRELDGIRQRSSPDEEPAESPISDAVLHEVEKVLRTWSEQVEDLGGRPKGYFTVDFQSIDPEMQYCWNYGEGSIGFTHKIWENFSHRRPLAESVEGTSDHRKWIH